MKLTDSEINDIRLGVVASEDGSILTLTRPCDLDGNIHLKLQNMYELSEATGIKQSIELIPDKLSVFIGSYNIEFTNYVDYDLWIYGCNLDNGTVVVNYTTELVNMYNVDIQNFDNITGGLIRPPKYPKFRSINRTKIT